MAAGKFGRVITMSPPITTDMRMYKGKTGYFMSKVRCKTAHNISIRLKKYCLYMGHDR